ncbi:MAG: CBS domain-containing protein [Planctomycetota bacterium]
MQLAVETVRGLAKRFGSLVTANAIKAEGFLDGTFQVVFDQGGLFTLAGVISMHPDQMIQENRKLGSLEKARNMSELLAGVGDVLVGSWDRVFRKGLDGHGRFVRANIFIGNPWEKSEETIGLSGDEDLLLVTFEITIFPHSSFRCGVILPRGLLAHISSATADGDASGEEETQGEVDGQAQEPETVVEGAEAKKTDATPESESGKPEPEESNTDKEPTDKSAAGEDNDQAAVAEEQATTVEEASEPGDDPGDVSEESARKEPQEAPEQNHDGVNMDTSDHVVEEGTPIEEAGECEPVGEGTEEVAPSSAVFAGDPVPTATAGDMAHGDKLTALTILARDIMQKDVLWANPDDTVQQALNEMEQQGLDCVVVGQNGALEGIVTMCDLRGAMSPYLKPTFAKWRRPLDDATLQIKIKWVMSKPVHTVRPDMPLATVMEIMCRSGRRVLPVTDERNQVQGLVTLFDVFRTLLHREPDTPTEPKEYHAPAST